MDILDLQHMVFGGHQLSNFFNIFDDDAFSTTEGGNPVWNIQRRYGLQKINKRCDSFGTPFESIAQEAAIFIEIKDKYTL